MVEAPHPQSVICTTTGRAVALKVHQCVWSGAYAPNSLAAIQDCYRARVVRAEIDVAMLKDADFLVVHDLHLAPSTDGDGRVDETRRSDAVRVHLRHHGRVHPALLSEVVAAIAAEPYPTLLELDLKDWKPWPWPRVEELARVLQPVKDRITFGGGADWNLRRLQHVDPNLPMGFTITDYLDWGPAEQPIGPPAAGSTAEPRLPGVRGAYGYLDAHPLAQARLGSTADYLRDRIGAIVRLVPRAREIHIRLLAVEHMLADGLTDLADLLHAQGMLLDVWTLNAGTPRWRERLEIALAAGADVITTETPRELAQAAILA
ncbi:MAG TPA: glycerophosphodiester phosphodiesterase family protein [Chloroflexota bacterium]|nr:glycerophosphodiester phosphodiesterase family protein [Chloroflexota bacterium]